MGYKVRSFSTILFLIMMCVHSSARDERSLSATRKNDRLIGEFNQDVTFEVKNTFIRRGLRNDPSTNSEQFYIYDSNSKQNTMAFKRGQRVRFERFEGYHYRFLIWGPYLSTYYGHRIQPLDENNNPVGKSLFIFTRVEDRERDIKFNFFRIIDDEISSAHSPDFSVAIGTPVLFWRDPFFLFNEQHEFVKIPKMTRGQVIAKNVIGADLNTPGGGNGFYLRLKIKLTDGQIVYFQNYVFCGKDQCNDGIPYNRAYSDLIITD